MSFGQYTRFLFVGAFVGIITVGCRELIGHLLVADTQRNYSISVASAYATGIALSFLLNHRFTFGKTGGQRSWGKFVQFAAIAIVGLISTWLLSLALRYGLHLDARIGQSARLVAFVGATLLSSALTYPLNSMFVFSEPRLRAAPISSQRT
jgi:putative flippase GtrA